MRVLIAFIFNPEYMLQSSAYDRVLTSKSICLLFFRYELWLLEKVSYLLKTLVVIVFQFEKVII